MGLGLLLCGIVAECFPSRPACVTSYGAALYASGTWHRAVHSWLPRPCPETSCAQPLRRVFGSVFNASAHDDGGCWVVSDAGGRRRGLVRRRARPGAKGAGVAR